MLRIILPGLMAVITAFVAGNPSWAESRPSDGDNGLRSQSTAQESTTPPVWIVVNLFTGRSSKQAVRVRDTFMELGAEGNGVVLPFAEITVDRIERMKPSFLVLSPNGIPWCRYKGKNGVDLQNFLDALKVIVEELNVPVVGICGGHQAIALAFGGKVGPILGGEDDCFPYGKNPTERGRRHVGIMAHDPIFLGMDPMLNMVENHYDEVKRLPQGFVWLAGNQTSKYQIIRHPQKPAYGIQAHSEYFFGSKPDGGLLLRNFIHVAKTHNRLTRTSVVRSEAEKGRSEPVREADQRDTKLW
jgi:GMP synthase (glutamine-hydrolysing)